MFVFFSQALSNEANELLPIFNKTTSKVYRTTMPTGDWSNQATNIASRQLCTNLRKHQLPQSLSNDTMIGTGAV